MDENYIKTWALEVGARVNDLAVSANGQLVVIGADNGLHVVNSQGDVLWTDDRYPVYSVSVSQDSEAIVADGGSKVWLYYRDGTVFWEWNGDPIARGIVLTETNLVLIASRDAIHCVAFFDNQPRWSYSWGAVSGICATPDGQLVIAGTEGGEILLLDETGRLIDLFNPGGNIRSLSVDSQGELVVALDHEKGRILLYDFWGSLLWERAPVQEERKQIAAVSMSGDGTLIASSLRSEAILWDREGVELARYGMDEGVRLPALSAERTVIVIGGENGRVEFRTSDSASSAMSESQLWEVISRIRRDYLAEPVSGFCAWLDEFDQALPREQFDSCDALLDEIGHDYPLTAFERAYVESRPGALWLGRGIAFHRLGEYERARECYRKGLRSHTESNNLEGEGQARLLLDLLPESGPPEKAPRGFTAQLKALGSAESFLTHQVENGAPPEQMAAVLTAGRSGYMKPLLMALNRSDAVANIAAAALGSLSPGPSDEILFQVMSHPNWFVRWRAISILRQRDEEAALPWDLSAVVQAIPNEPDPAVLRNLIRVIEQNDDRECAAAVIPLVLDSDADVRHAVCRALVSIGDRRAIQPLKLTPDGYAFFDGGWVHDAVEGALSAIEERYPAPEVERVALFRRFEEEGDAPLPTQVFPLTTSTIYGLVTLKSGWRNVRVDLHDDSLYTYRIVLDLTGDAPGESKDSVFFFDDEDKDPLVELLLNDDEAEDRDISFSIPSPLGEWREGIYQLDVYLNGEPEAGHLFWIVETAPIERVAVAATSDNLPGSADFETDVILAGWTDLNCFITMDGFAGLRIEGRVFDETGDLIVEAVKRFPEDSRRIQLPWPRVNLRPGVYTAVAKCETGTSKECRFRVVESVQVLDLRLALLSETPGSSDGTVSVYGSNDDIALTVELTPAPAGFPVSVEWRCGSKSIGDGPSIYITERSGGQKAYFSLHSPEGGWMGGSYSAVIRLNGRIAKTISFEVTPPPLSQRLGALAGKTSAYLKRQAGRFLTNEAGKSAFQWLLVGIVFYSTDWLVGKIAGNEVVSSTLPLYIAHRIAGLRFFYWWIAGGLYWTWKSHRLANSRLPRRVTLILSWVVFSLLAQQIAHIVFGLGRLWPNALGGLFKEVLFARPYYAWGSVILLAFIGIAADSENNDEYKPASLGILLMIPMLYIISLLVGAGWGIVAWGSLTLFSKLWAQTAWTFGIKIGFNVSTIGVIRSGFKSASEK